MSELTVPTELPSSLEMAALDAAAIAAGVTARTLMERAGRAALRAATERYPKLAQPQSAVLILCGGGNNGGDGAVIARALREKGIEPFVFLVSAERYSELNQEQFKLFVGEGGQVHRPDCTTSGPGDIACWNSLIPLDSSALGAKIAKADFIFDALLGTGQRSAPRATIAETIHLLNEKRSDTAQVISVDLPTGVDAETGTVYHPHVKADLTIAIAFVKRGLVQSPAFENCGDINTIDIGIRATSSVEFSALTRGTIPSFPTRHRDAHKGSAGRVLVIGGSAGMPGAPMLSALGALRTGAGIVVATRLDSAASAGRPLELIDLPLDGSALKLAHLEKLKIEAQLADAIVLGPGLGRAEETRALLHQLLPYLKECASATVVDADALNIISEQGLGPLWSHCVATPHPGEAARLLASDTATIQADRYAAARSLAGQTHAITVLKGASTIVYGEGRGAVNTTGNPWMATPGSGDVLAGIIGTLLAQKLPAFDAATLGVYLHGLAGDLAHKSHNGPITATDIAAMIPHATGILR